MTEKAKHCPHCDLPMRRVETRSHEGGPIFLDQCPECGGLWCDVSEPFRTRLDEADEFDTVDAEKLSSVSIITHESLSCPNDRAVLRRFTDANFPQSLIVESCPTCGGFWFNRGEFSAFQDDRRQFRETDQEISEKVGAMLRSSSNTAAYVTAGNLANFLSTPIDRTSLRPMDLGNTENEKKAAKAIDYSSSIIRIFLEILLGKLTK